MKKIGILFILLITASQLFAWDHYGVIRMMDGRSSEGLIYSMSGQLEWRQDIYEFTAENGKTERFILKPEKKGGINLSEIKEIRRVPSDAGPSQYVTLSNNIRAKLVIRYLVIYKNERKFYISDLITLNNFSLEMPNSKDMKQLYLSQINLLQFTDPINSVVTVKAPVQKETPPVAIKQPFPDNSISAVTFRTQMVTPKEHSSLITTLIMIISFLAAVSILLLIILLVKKGRKKGLHHRKLVKAVKHIKKKK